MTQWPSVSPLNALTPVTPRLHVALAARGRTWIVKLDAGFLFPGHSVLASSIDRLVLHTQGQNQDTFSQNPVLLKGTGQHILQRFEDCYAFGVISGRRTT